MRVMSITAGAQRLWDRIERNSSSTDAAQAIVASVKADPNRMDLLRALATGNSDQQTWVLAYGYEILGADFAPILSVLAEASPDRDVRSDALHALARIDVGLLAPYVERLRRQLRAKDSVTPITAIWMLARLRDADSLSLIETLENDRDRPLVRFSAQVAAMLLRGQDSTVLQAIHDHDHLRMPWLIVGAEIVGSAEAERALADCARNAPDEECQRRCAIAVAGFTRI
jgi:hypothetical protein